jgi:hypothetical protein
MNPVAKRRIEPAAADFLGPAEVVEVQGDEVVVELRGGEPARAALALATPYEPVAGDVLLVIGKDGEHYAIGVLRGSGKTALRVQGDLEVRAEGGAVRIVGDRGVELHAPELTIHAGKLQVIASAAVQKFTSLYQRVSELLSVRAGQAHTVVDEGTVTQAKRASIVTEETVTINGREVHLG